MGIGDAVEVGGLLNKAVDHSPLSLPDGVNKNKVKTK